MYFWLIPILVLAVVALWFLFSGRRHNRPEESRMDRAGK
jgi:hypothetical protein